MEDFNRQYIKEHFAKLTPEERREILQALPPGEQAEVLQALPPEQRRGVLQSLPPEEQAEVLQALPPEQRLAGLSAEQIRRYLDQLTAAVPPSRASRGGRGNGAQVAWVGRIGKRDGQEIRAKPVAAPAEAAGCCRGT